MGNIAPHLEQLMVDDSDYKIMSVAHHEVRKYLCAADVGLLFRDRHILNEVACPGKFAEYMLTGLPLMMTEGIGDYSREVKGWDSVCVIPSPDDVVASAAQINKFC